LFHKISSFFYFLIKSKNEHGVHSPFVFDLITSCFYKKKNNEDLDVFLNYKKELLKNSLLLEITNLSFFSNLLISNKRVRLLINTLQYLNIDSILEIGTFIGDRTAALASTKENLKITTLEENEQISTIISKLFKKYHFKNIQIVTGSYDKTLPQALNNNNNDFIYFKGKNIDETTLKYFEFSLTYIHNDSVILFENIHSDKKSEKIWNHIKNNKKVTVTIDTFLWGFVFFRKEQEKEHFIIRI
jgi:predicted O-methyltransferase YrrM